MGRTKAAPAIDCHQVESEIARRRETGAAGPLAPHELSLEEREHDAHMAHLRARADALFEAMDANGNGYVNRCGVDGRGCGAPAWSIFPGPNGPNTCRA